MEMMRIMKGMAHWRKTGGLVLFYSQQNWTLCCNGINATTHSHAKVHRLLLPKPGQKPLPQGYGKSPRQLQKVRQKNQLKMFGRRSINDDTSVAGIHV